METILPTPTAPPSNLIGKAGVGLAIFHFARLGFEANVTDFNSSSCDLWVRFPHGIEMVEIKTSIKDLWSLRGCQASIAQWFFFASLKSGAAWLLSGAKVKAMYDEKGKPFVIPLHQMERIADLCFHRDGPAMVLTPEVAERIHQYRTTPRQDRAPKTVRKKLADGTIKLYKYAR